MKIIDFHTHIFPDKIAKQAIDALAADAGDYKPRTDGTLQALLDSMKASNISASLVANIATRPSQMLPIFAFCMHIKSESIYPLISVHPSNDLEEVEELFNRAAEAGLHGVKLHPMYQGFFIDDKKMYALYELMTGFGFFLIFHSGYDIAFPGNTQADVERIRKIADAFKDLTIVCTHVGGWKQWDRVSCLSPCNNVLTETSMTLTEVSDDEFIRAISNFGEDRVLFGSDSPWTDQKEMLERTLRLNLPDRMKEKMVYTNAARLLKRS